MTDKEYFYKQTKEQIIIFLQNEQFENQKLRLKLELLTGCQGFGDADGMDGSCVECSYNDPKQFERCHTFRGWLHEYKNRIKRIGELKE